MEEWQLWLMTYFCCYSVDELWIYHRRTALSYVLSDTFVAVLITDDGISGDERRLIKEAQLTKRKGIYLIVIGVGDGVDEGVLISVASDHKLYMASSFEQLSTMSIKLTLALCQGTVFYLLIFFWLVFYVCPW